MKKFVLKLQPNSGQGKNIFFAKVIKDKIIILIRRVSKQCAKEVSFNW